MNKVSKLGQTANLILYLTLQFAVARFIVLFHTGSCFVYVAFLLLLPQRQEALPLLLLLSFVIGLFVDMFYNSLGLHASAAVLMVYTRSFLLKRTFSVSGYEVASRPTLAQLGWRQFSLLTIPLIMIHHAALFLPDVGSTTLFLVVIRKLFFSTLLTYVAVLITQVPTLLFSKR